MVKRSLFAIVLSSFSVVEAADKLAGGPYVVNVGPRKATIGWVIQTSEAKLGLAPGKLDKSGPVLRSNKVTVAGLEPGKTYYYDVTGTPEGTGHFKTAPVGRSSSHFVVYGDTRTRHEVHRRVVAAIAKVQPDFVLLVGDLVADGDDTALWPIFFSIEKDLLNKTAFFPVLGNHERNSRRYYEFFDATTPYYSFNWGTAHFAVLNTDVSNLAASRAVREALWNEQTGWLEADLARAQKADFRFVAMHHPPFTAVKSRQGQDTPGTALVPLFEKYKVHAVFCGHDHNYQHHLKNGIRYLVSGGGGAPLYPTDSPIPGITQRAESVENFLKVSVEGNTALIEAFRPDGSSIDKLSLP